MALDSQESHAICDHVAEYHNNGQHGKNGHNAHSYVVGDWGQEWGNFTSSILHHLQIIFYIYEHSIMNLY